ncbi:unnamed protein product [Pleuronectes platessa]|uniref:VWA N-terminal domain-containing protein n=1 Tax=Pleuronectes platessa TaxID=8262 RepID=A0A9N7U2I4_PLEPL|nr:unnamed protein product [Pleuronectes platessa]
MDTCRVPAWVFLVLVWHGGCLASQFPTQLMIKEWVDQMQKELVTLADTATGGMSLTQIFRRNQHLYSVEQNDAEELVARAARNIEQLLRKRSAALKKLAAAAEQFQLDHTWKDEFEDDEISYYNSKDNLDANETEGKKYRLRPDFKEDASFRRLTDHNHTAVHIPTDIYDGCDRKWEVMSQQRLGGTAELSEPLSTALSLLGNRLAPRLRTSHLQSPHTQGQG